MSWLDDVPIERKLRLAMLITSMLALLVACGVFLTVEYIGYRRNAVQLVTTVARLTAENSTAAIAFADRPGAQQLLEALRAEPQIVAASLYDERGELFAMYSEVGGDVPEKLTFATPASTVFFSGHVHGVQPVAENGRRLGTLYVKVSLRLMYERMQMYALMVLGVMAASFVVAWLVASSLQRTISRPILELVETASAVANGSGYSLRARHYSRDELGRLTLAFNAMLERTEALVEKVAQARDQAVAASRAKDEFLAALSHELRTPLNPVLMLASDAAANPALPAAVREDFARIAKHVTLEARLIDDLLDLTRITRGKLALELRTCDVNTILRDALATVSADVDAKKLTLRVDLGATVHQVRGDAVRLQQVFWNVLKNAVKFTPAGGHIDVATCVATPATGIIITVSDSGIGMTPVEIEKAFEAFSQGEHGENGGGHRFGGLGLGLAITRTLLELHGGSIAALSRGRDQGATFVIELPLYGGASSDSTAVTAGGEKTVSPVGGSRPPVADSPASNTAVLVVEDHGATRMTLAHLLTRRGFHVVTAATLAEARKRAEERAFDLIISDIGLPDGSGYTFMSEYRSRRPGVPGIALSGYGMEDDVARSQAAGFAAHLIKPLDVKTLDDAIARVLPRGAARSNVGETR